VIDHGAKPSAFYHPLTKRMADADTTGASTTQPAEADGSNNEGEQQHFTILFAGPNEKADDVIARDVGRIASAVTRSTRAAASTEETRNTQRIPKLPQQHDLAVDLDVIRVVTSDQGLRSRCRLAFDNAVMGNDIVEYGRKNKKKRRRKRNNGQKQSDAAVNLEFVPSVGYLSQLEREIVKYGKARDSQHDHRQDVLDERIVEALHTEVELRGKLYQVECCLRDAKTSSRAVQRKSLIEQGRKISEKIYNLCNANGQTILGSVISSDEVELDIDGVKVDAANVSCMLPAWDEVRRKSGRAELTGDRRILAENMRRILEKRFKDSSSLIDTPEQQYNPSAFHYMCHKTFHNTRAARDEKSFTVNAFEAARKALRLVIVSDGISRSSKPLPSGDVLFHLGNFTPDENLGARQRRQKLAQFNEWLSNQPHSIKIVLRGSRDPTADKLVLPFPGAVYVDIPRTVSFGGGNFVLTLIPHCTSRILSSSWRRLPHTFDAVVSHDVPILGGQDNSGDSQERPSQTSLMISNKIENMFSGPPSLWLGGNASEGFDKTKTRLAPSSTSMLDTTIVFGKRPTVSDDGHSEGCTYMHPLVIDVEKKASDREMTFNGSMVVTRVSSK